MARSYWPSFSRLKPPDRRALSSPPSAPRRAADAAATPPRRRPPARRRAAAAARLEILQALIEVRIQIALLLAARFQALLS